MMQKGFDVVNFHGTASGLIATPYIGENNNWWIGNEDTGISAKGIKGDKGLQGETGPVGPQGAKGQDADVAELEKLKEDVVQLNNDLTWKFAGAVTGKTHVTLPSKFKEIYIETYVTGNNIVQQFVIMFQALDSTNIKRYRATWFSEITNYEFVEVACTTTECWVERFYRIKEDIISSCGIRVWYR